MLRNLKKVFLIAALVALGAGFRFVRVWTPNPATFPPPMPVPRPNGFDAFVQAGAFAGQNDARADALVRRGLSLPCVYPTVRSLSAPVTSKVAPIRHLARQMQTRALVLQKARPNDPTAWKDSVSLGLDTLEMGVRVPRGSNTVASLVGDAVIAIGNYALEETPNHIDGPTARSSAQRIEKILSQQAPLAQILTEEKLSFQTELATATNKAISTNRTKSRFSPGGSIVRAVLNYDVAHYFDAIIADSAVPYARRQTQFSSPTGFAAGSFQSMFPRLRFSDARATTTLQLLAVRFALRSFQLSKGRYSATLNELTPLDLQRVPTDPFGGGQPLRYRREGWGYRLWSVGPDATDDKGKTVRWKRSRSGSRYYAPESLGDVTVVQP